LVLNNPPISPLLSPPPRAELPPPPLPFAGNPPLIPLLFFPQVDFFFFPQSPQSWDSAKQISGPPFWISGFRVSLLFPLFNRRIFLTLKVGLNPPPSDIPFPSRFPSSGPPLTNLPPLFSVFCWVVFINFFFFFTLPKTE